MSRVSFIIAAYNEELFLKECIESCLNQTYSDIEVCITDDGSIDNTWDILESYNVDSRVKIGQFHKNEGKVAAFNHSFSMAVGEYVAIIGADDVNFHDRIASQISHINKTESDLVWGGLEVVDQVLRPLETISSGGPVHVTPKSILERNVVTGGTVLMTRDLALKLFPLPSMLEFEDWWIGYKACSLGKLSYQNDLLIMYRQHANNAAGGSDKNTFDQLKTNFTRHMKFYEVVRTDVNDRYAGAKKTELLRIINGSVAYRKISLCESPLQRFMYLFKNFEGLFSLSFPLIIKAFVMVTIGPQILIKLKGWIKS